jgi:hypothetical protein
MFIVVFCVPDLLPAYMVLLILRSGNPVLKNYLFPICNLNLMLQESAILSCFIQSFRKGASLGSLPILLTNL